MAMNLPQFLEYVVHAEGSKQQDGRNGRTTREYVGCIKYQRQKTQKGIFLQCANEEVHDIFTTLTLAQEEEDSYKQDLDALDDYFVPKQNKLYDIYNSDNPNWRQKIPQTLFIQV